MHVCTKPKRNARGSVHHIVYRSGLMLFSLHSHDHCFMPTGVNSHRSLWCGGHVHLLPADIQSARSAEYYTLSAITSSVCSAAVVLPVFCIALVVLSSDEMIGTARQPNQLHTEEDIMSLLNCSCSVSAPSRWSVLVWSGPNDLMELLLAFYNRITHA